MLNLVRSQITSGLCPKTLVLCAGFVYRVYLILLGSLYYYASNPAWAALHKEVHTYTKNTFFFGKIIIKKKVFCLFFWCANPTVLGVLVGPAGQ